MYLPERSILHLNVADFPVAVERVVDLCLREKPVIIAPLGAARAVVHDMSEEAFQEGVRKGMPLKQAIKRSRKAALLPPRFPLYQKAMVAFIKKGYDFTPQMEFGAADGHLFLDVTGSQRLLGSPPDIGWRMQKESQKHLQLHPIWALASNKLVAKVASRLVKPVGEYIVAPGEERDFLAPLPIALLPGISKKEYIKLHEFNLRSIGQLAALDKNQLSIPFNKRADSLYEFSRGIDKSPVDSGDITKKPISFEHSFSDDTNNQKQVESLVAQLAAKLGNKLRQEKRTAKRVGIYLIYSDGGTTIRQATRKQASASDYVLTKLGLLALQRAWTRRTRLRSCQLCCDLFSPQSPQLSLFELTDQKELHLSQVEGAMDSIRSRFGNEAILTGLQHHYQKQ